jgi:AraC family transcriptional regulator
MQAIQSRIENQGDFTVVGYETTTRYDDTAHIPALFVELDKNLELIRNKTMGHDVIGVALRDGKEDFTYVVGAMVSAAEELPEGMVARTVAAHEYAVLTHRGPIRKIGETYAYFYETWLPENGYERPMVPFFEVYGAPFSNAEEGPEADASECEIWLPIRQRA